MARICSTERIIEYSVDFKIKVVELTDKLDVETTRIASGLGLHPVMVYRWRQEYREGKLVAPPTRKISMTKDNPDNEKERDDSQAAELAKLKKEVAELKKENSFLKKWERYLEEESRRDSDS